VSVFSDQRIIDALRDFVSVVQDTSLQNHTEDDELSQFFRNAIRKAKFLTRQNITDFSFAGVKPTRHGVTTQGLYMFNAAGNPKTPEPKLDTRDLRHRRRLTHTAGTAETKIIRQ